MSGKRVSVEFGGLIGLLVLAAILAVVWWMFSALLSVTLGQLLILAAVGVIGFVIGKATS